MGDYAKQFFATLAAKHITIEQYLGQGTSIIETIEKISQTLNLDQIPADASDINIVVIGGVIYFILYRDLPMSIKITSPEIAGIVRLLLEMCG